MNCSAKRKKSNIRKDHTVGTKGQYHCAPLWASLSAGCLSRRRNRGAYVRPGVALGVGAAAVGAADCAILWRL